MSPSLLCLCLVFALAFADEGCDTTRCKGPIKYYEELACKPVYAKEGDCCPIKYDCSHLERRAPNKCYVNGHEYSGGDVVREEDGTRICDFQCTCNEYNNKARFACLIVNLTYGGPPKPGCFLKSKLIDGICNVVEVCTKEGENQVTCVVDGKTYLAGQSFYPQQKPDSSCICKEGFKGEFVEPFCKKVACGTELLHTLKVKSKCAPIYGNAESPVTSCNSYFRCQNNKDKVIKASGEASSGVNSSDMKCAFGDLLMNIGDELNRATNFDSVCVKCVCEVPPTPTCRQLSSSECDMTKLPDFD